MAYVDARELVQLATMDLLGMTFFRIMGEVLGRPAGTKMDAARETFIRENMGMLCNVFLAGWVATAALKSLGKSVNWYNPHGIPAPAWVHAQRLEAFSNLYRDILKTPGHTPQTAREELVRRVLSGLVSSNHKLHLAGTLEAAKTLDLPARVDFLKKQAEEFMPGAAHGLLGEIHPLPLETQAERLSKALLEQSANGKLTPSALEKLSNGFAWKNLQAPESALGTNNFNERALALVREAKQNIIDEAKRQHRPVDAVLQHFNEGKEFDKARLQLSLQDLVGEEKGFVQRISEAASKGGLNQLVDLIDPRHPQAAPILKGVKRDILLRDLKHYLEQFVDRAQHGVGGQATGWQPKVWSALTDTSTRKGFWRRWVPQLEDGLVTSALKSKNLYTWFPIWSTIIIGVSVGFLNNWLTRRKHGGMYFFPGDAPPTENAGGNQPPHAPSLPPTGVQPGAFPNNVSPSLVRRPIGAFAQMQAYRTTGQGGLS